MSIRLQFVREAALSSDLIAWFSHGGGFSHVDAIAGHGKLLLGARSDRVMDAHGKLIPAGVHLRQTGYSNFVRRVVFEVPCTDAQRVLFWTFLYDQIGKPYDHRAIWAFALDRDWRAPDSWICSELQMAALEYASIISSTEYVPTAKITPRDVALVISAIGAKVLCA